MAGNRAAALHRYTREAVRKPFKPGGHDCALFAAAWVQIVTDRDLAQEFRGYGTLKEGQERIRKAGFSDHIDMAAAEFAEIPPLMAQVGDLAVVDADTGPALGIVGGARVWVLRLEGLGHVPLTRATRAFRVA